MNPLDLTGPEFLRFYFTYGVAILVLARMAQALLGRSAPPIPRARWIAGVYPRARDAYAIAILRGGRQEAVRTLLARLVGLDLLTVGDEGGLVPKPEAEEPDLLPIEAAAWNAIRREASLTTTAAEWQILGAVGSHLREIELELEEQGVLPDRRRRTAYRTVTFLAAAAILGMGLAKLGVALSRGRTNIFFLLLLLVIFTIALFVLLRLPRRTSAGEQYLAWLREAHRGIVRETRSGQRRNAGEIALAAGIYGLVEVPDLAPLNQSFARHDQRKRDDSGGSSSSSSSCSSGSSDSGGSSCGGGCGGGGCGGCGG